MGRIDGMNPVLEQTSPREQTSFLSILLILLSRLVFLRDSVVNSHLARWLNSNANQYPGPRRSIFPLGQPGPSG